MDLTAEDETRAFLEKIAGDPRVGRITVRTLGGAQLTGTIGPIGRASVIIRALSGREFYDAYVRLDAITSIEVQTRS